MSISPISPSITPGIPRPKPNIQFGGMADAFANVIGVIDSNRVIELVASDGLGMIAPRSLMALLMRGPDDGRETLIREVSGLVGNMFVVGWSSLLMMKLLGSRINFYNPNGVPAKAWISADSLEAFSKAYEGILSEAKTPQEARKQFTQWLVNAMISGDKEFSLQSRILTLDALPDEARNRALEQMLSELFDNRGQAQTLMKEYGSLRGEELIGRMQGNDSLMKAWGRLTPRKKAELQQAFDWRVPVSAPDGSKVLSALGTNPFDAQAEQNVRKLQEQFVEKHALGKELAKIKNQGEQAVNEFLQKKGFDWEERFVTERLRLSQKSDPKLALELMERIASQGQLSSTVNLADEAGEVLLKDKNLKTLLGEAVHFMEQIVDRATYKVSHQPNWQETVYARMFNREKGLIKGLIPQKADGLVTTMLKSKKAFTWVPVLAAIAFAGGITYYNNWLTKKKHGGKVFFPGEGVPPAGSTGATEPGKASAQQQPASRLQRNQGVFAQFQRSQHPSGGIIA